MSYKLKIIENYEEVSQYKQDWIRLELLDSECTLFQSFNWVDNYCKFLLSDKKIYIILFFEHNTLVGIFPLQIRNFRNVAIYEFMGSCGADYLMPLAIDTKKSKLYREFCNWLEQQSYECIYVFEDLPCYHSFSKYIVNYNFLRCTLEYQDCCLCYIIQLPDTWEKYKESLSKRMRQDIEYDRRYLNKNIKAEYRELDINSLDTHILYNKSRMHSKNLKSPFDFKEACLFWKTYFNDEFIKNRLKINALVLNGEIVASFISLDMHQKKYIISLNINSKYAKLSPGNVLLGYIIQEAIDKGVRSIDLGRGKDNYKLRFGATEYINGRHIICMDSEKRKQYISYIYYLYNKIGYYLTDQ